MDHQRHLEMRSYERPFTVGAAGTVDITRMAMMISLPAFRRYIELHREWRDFNRKSQQAEGYRRNAASNS